MCNEYQIRKVRPDLGERFSQLKIPMTWADAEPNRPLDQPIRPTNRAPVIRAVDPADPTAGLEGLQMRWWLTPFFHKGPLKDWKAMCTNARLETVDSTPAFREPYRRRRCLVPVTSFIEYDTPPGWKKGDPKRRWEITWPDGDVRYFAGLWDRASPSDMPEGLDSFAFVTGPPGPDVARIHTRQARVLTAEQGLEWLRLDGPGKAMLEDPGNAGALVLTPRPRELDSPGD